MILDSGLTGVDYDKLNVVESNDFFSRTEEEALDHLENDTLQFLLKKKQIIDNSLNSLNDKEYDMIVDYFWEDKTQEEMANGEYGTYVRQTIDNKLQKIYSKLKNAGILNTTKL